jgi:hypothetical protein
MALTEEVPVTTNLEDTMLIAFLLLKGHKIKEWRRSDEPDRVSFDVEGNEDSIVADMNKYYNNEVVGIQDFVKCLKEVKSRMYNMKKIKQRKE